MLQVDWPVAQQSQKCTLQALRHRRLLRFLSNYEGIHWGELGILRSDDIESSEAGIPGDERNLAIRGRRSFVIEFEHLPSPHAQGSK
jgi:hypothetical protein